MSVDKMNLIETVNISKFWVDSPLFAQGSQEKESLISVSYPLEIIS